MEDNTKRKILSATKELVALHGFSNVTTRQIASRAGVNISMINYYFKSKDNLLKQLLEEIVSTFDITIRKETDLISCADQLLLFISKILEKVKHNRTSAIILIREQMGNYFKISPAIKHLDEKLFSQFEQILEHGRSNGQINLKFDDCMFYRLIIGLITSVIVSHLQMSKHIKNSFDDDIYNIKKTVIWLLHSAE